MSIDDGDQPDISAGLPTVPNPRRLPTADLTDGVELFAPFKQILGAGHRLDSDSAETVPCGAACPHRVASISCPFWPGTPCLVGCQVKQVLAGQGLQYGEIDLFVVTQSGRFLIGQESLINLDNPLMSHLRIITDKRGRPVVSTGAPGLLDVKPATIFNSIEVTHDGPTC